jgi:hypothetical protein
MKVQRAGAKASVLLLFLQIFREVRVLKLVPARSGGKVVGYRLYINKTEAEASGLIDSNGEPVEIEKIVDPIKRTITLKRIVEGTAGDAVRSTFIYENLEDLLSGKRMRTTKNYHYIMKEDVLYKQDHQSYMRGEEPSPYAEFVGGVFYALPGAVDEGE